MPTIGVLFRYILPVANYKGILNLPDKELKNWSYLDTFDGISARYEKRQRYSKIKNILQECGIVNVENHNKLRIYVTGIKGSN